MEKIEYGGWENCIRLTNGEIEIVATTDVGPRIIRFGFVGGRNVFSETKETLGKTGGDEWRGYGGSRLWHAPESIPRTYSLDNSSIEYVWTGETLKLIQPMEEDNRLVKEIDVTLDDNANHATLVHRITNKNLWDVKLAPWVLTVMAPGGRAILPQEEYRSHPEYLLPARPLVLWHYTDMADPRWTWGTKYIQLQQDPNGKTKQKIGIMNTKGWAAYALKGDLFIKRFPYDPEAEYVDYRCNTEIFTNAAMLEVESLGPLTNLPPDGGFVEHTEHWFLFKADPKTDETSIDTTVMPLVKQTDKITE